MFKVGDWVTCSYAGKNRPYKILDKKIARDCNNGNRKDVELWQPKEGEVCIFEDYNSEHPFIARCTEKLKRESLWWEPFIGELPSFLKD